MGFGKRRDCNDSLKCIAWLHQLARVEIVRQVIGGIENATADRFFEAIGQRYSD
jgi:hypothetical protein